MSRNIWKDRVHSFFRKLERIYRHAVRPARIRNNSILIPLFPEISDSMRKALYERNYETAEFAAVMRYLEPHDRVLEFGSGLGYITTLCAKICGSESVITCEANPEMISAIQDTFRLNKVEPRLLNCAVAKHDGQANLKITGNFWSSSTQRQQGVLRSIVCKTVAFERIVREVKPTFLILDIEGGEICLAEERIPTTVRKLLIEMHESVVGHDGVERVRKWITDNDFVVVQDRGNRSVVYYERTA